MSESKASQEGAASNGAPNAPSAGTLTDAVVAALAQQPALAAVQVTEASDTPRVSVVPAIAVGAPSGSGSDDPVLTTIVDEPREESAPAQSLEEAIDAAAQSAAVQSAAVQAAAQSAAADGAGPTLPAPVAEPTRHDEATAKLAIPAAREPVEGISVRYYGRTDVGLVREHNEDNFMVADLTAAIRGADEPRFTPLGNKGCVFAVCDGMGGAAAGEVASQMAVDTIHEMMMNGGPPKDRDHFARRLVRAVEEAGSRIFAAAKLDRSRRGMGTTSTVAGLVDGTLFVGQVGDSRAYVLRGDQFALISKDQSLVNQLIEAGQLTEEEAEAFEHSNIILQALGTTEEVSVDLTFLELRRGDRLLLCSDGLSGLVHAEMMKDVLKASRDLPEAAQQLIAMANAGGGHDNITVVLVEFDGLALKETQADAKVAYQQYPLPPPTPDTIDPPPPRPMSMKPASSKPGADVKGTVDEDGVEPAGGTSGRWWIVAVLVLLVVALVGAIVLAVQGDGEVREHATRSVVSRPTTVSATPRATPMGRDVPPPVASGDAPSDSVGSAATAAR